MREALLDPARRTLDRMRSAAPETLGGLRPRSGRKRSPSGCPKPPDPSGAHGEAAAPSVVRRRTGRGGSGDDGAAVRPPPEAGPADPSASAGAPEAVSRAAA